MRFITPLLFAALAATGLAAQTPTTTSPEPAPPPISVAPPPRTHVPSAIALEVSLLERTFETALAADCAPERCFPKGCVYVRHQTIDQPRNGSLPGLPVEQGIGSVPAQEYLTEARCEFTHERSVNAKDIQALVRRLELRLSRGYRKVVVGPQSLEPINRSLAEPTIPPDEQPKNDKDKDEDEAPKEEVAPPPPPPPVVEKAPSSPWRELWEELLPHTAWMVAILLLTGAVVVLIWATRKLGAPTLEEKMILAQLAQNPPPPPEPTPRPTPTRTPRTTRTPPSPSNRSASGASAWPASRTTTAPSPSCCANGSRSATSPCWPAPSSPSATASPSRSRRSPTSP
jgi:hypothetical protein